MKKTEIAKKIERLFKKHTGEITDTRIYFGGKAWNYDSQGNKTVLKDIKGSDYTYSNDKTITCTFEGPVYDELNYNYTSTLPCALNALFEEYGYYYETGHAWSFSLYGDGV
jgi:hypothetical protein